MSTWQVRRELSLDHGLEASTAKGEEVLLFIGIIDVLQASLAAA